MRLLLLLLAATPDAGTRAPAGDLVVANGGLEAIVSLAFTDEAILVDERVPGHGTTTKKSIVSCEPDSRLHWILEVTSLGSTERYDDMIDCHPGETLHIGWTFDVALGEVRAAARWTPRAKPKKR